MDKPRRGRRPKPVDEVRSMQLHIAVTAIEKAKVHEAAKAAGVETASIWVRREIMKRADEEINLAKRREKAAAVRAAKGETVEATA